jgi:hypothetical protein
MILGRKRPSRKTAVDVFGFDVLLPDEARERFRQRLRGGHWWVLIADADGFLGVARIEARFYTGEASGDFEVLLPPGCPGLIIFFAHKRRMSPEQLYALYREHGDHPEITAELLRERDVLLVCKEENRGRMMGMAIGLNQWLAGVGPNVG